MKNIKIRITGLLLVLGIISPSFIFAATEAGLKPGNFFYIFDTASEKFALFFTFNPEKKAKKALEYADERLAEIEAVAETNPDAVKGILANYENNVALATEKSKEVRGEEQEENLLNLITDNASKNQEVLSAVLIKVPEEAKAAITQAIEASKRGQEEARKQITELKGEIEQLKKEVAELKTKDEIQAQTIEELNRQKSESMPTSINSSVSPTIETIQILKPATLEEKKGINITTLPNGAVVEMDANGNVLRYIKEVPAPVVIPISVPAPISNVNQIEIISADIISTLNTAAFEWTTNLPTESKVFVKAPSGVISVFQSISGLSTKHIVNATGLISNTQYTYEIEVINNQRVVKKTGAFQTLKETTPPKIIFHQYGDVNQKCYNCIAIGADEPVRITLYYADFDSIEEKRSGDIDWSGDINSRTKIIAEEIVKTGMLLTYQDDELKEWHLIKYDILPGVEKNKQYIYKFEATDAAGNVYKQKFTGSYGLPMEWNMYQFFKLIAE